METELEDITVTAKPLPDDQHLDSRDFRIESISLISCDGKARDITAMVIELQLRQDIYLGFMSGELFINDGRGLYSEVKFHGNEFVYIDIREPGQDVAIRKAYRVYKVSNRERQQNNASRYIVYLVSDELILSNSIRVSKAYQSMMVSDMAKDILVNTLKVPESRIFIDPTSDPQTYIIPNMRPFEALSWLATRAYTSTDTCYFFYENLDGFHFQSIQSLYKQESPVPQAYTDQHKGVEKSLASDKFSIDAWDGIKEFDVLSGLSDGMYSLGLLGIDHTFRTYNKSEYKLTDNMALYPSSPPSSIDSTSMGEGVTARYSTYLSAYNSKDWIKRVMSLAALNHSLTQIVIPGSVRVQVGTILNTVFPHLTTPTTTEDNVDKYRSGKYLVVAVNHKIDMTTLRYQTVVLLARDSQPEAYPSADPQIPDKIRKLNK